MPPIDIQNPQGMEQTMMKGETSSVKPKTIAVPAAANGSAAKKVASSDATQDQSKAKNGEIPTSQNKNAGPSKKSSRRQRQRENKKKFGSNKTGSQGTQGTQKDTMNTESKVVSEQAMKYMNTLVDPTDAKTVSTNDSVELSIPNAKSQSDEEAGEKMSKSKARKLRRKRKKNKNGGDSPKDQNSSFEEGNSFETQESETSSKSGSTEPSKAAKAGANTISPPRNTVRDTTKKSPSKGKSNATGAQTSLPVTQTGKNASSSSTKATGTTVPKQQQKKSVPKVAVPKQKQSKSNPAVSDGSKNGNIQSRAPAPSKAESVSSQHTATTVEIKTNNHPEDKLYDEYNPAKDENDKCECSACAVM